MKTHFLVALFIPALASAQTFDAPAVKGRLVAQAPAPAQARDIPVYRLELRCEIRGRELAPTPTIDRVWIAGNLFTQYDGGYVPSSALHAQGVQFVAESGKLKLARLDASASVEIGTLGASKPCTWDEELWQRDVTPTAETVVTVGHASACEAETIDMRPVYSKTADLTIAIKDAAGRATFLRSKVSMTSTSDKAECEKTPLGDTTTVYLP